MQSYASILLGRVSGWLSIVARIAYGADKVDTTRILVAITAIDTFAYTFFDVSWRWNGVVLAVASLSRLQVRYTSSNTITSIALLLKRFCRPSCTCQNKRRDTTLFNLIRQNLRRRS